MPTSFGCFDDRNCVHIDDGNHNIFSLLDCASFRNDNEDDMSRNYSASQYEKSFAPKRLQMYQVPKDPQPGIHAKSSGSTNGNSFLADNRGRLLPGVERSGRSPFGEYVGTWDLPKRIPGPYHVHPMGRTEKNFNSLCQQRDQTIQEMEQARVYEKEGSSAQQSC